MSFKLFRPPVEEASEYREDGACVFCEDDASPVFELGIGADVVVACASCGKEAALDADDREDAPCAHCGAAIAFPFSEDDELLVCAACLTAGRAALTKDTELGMVSWVEANEGWTHGLPGFRSTEWETAPPNEDGWVRVKVPREHLLELVRTPTYSTIQGERWLFCCHEPMAFIGVWSRERFDREANDGDGRRLFYAIVEQPVPGLWEDELHDETGVYVFECRRCSKRRAHWDIA